MVAAITAVMASSGNISSVANIAVFSIFLVYGFVNLSLIWLRYRRSELKRTFVSPGRIGKFPILAGLGLATSVVILSQFSVYTIVACMSTIVVSMLLFKITAKKKRAIKK
jgi:APA family basic amino acid/polyamine antiporter